MGKPKQSDFTEHNRDSWVECALCGHRGGHIRHHLKKTHGINSETYQEQYPGRLVSSSKMKTAISGEKNPAYQHGGRLSPFSDKFVGYSGIDKEHRDLILTDKKRSAEETRKKNNRHVTRLSYWVDKGLTEEEAILELKKRQTTFSLERCIERHGEEIGILKWEERQRKWLKTLSEKSHEETEDINRRKATRANYVALWGLQLDVPGIFYIITLADETIKFGVTSTSVQERYSRSQKLIKSVDFTIEGLLNDCFMVEQLVALQFKQHRVKKSTALLKEGWTEIISGIPSVVVHEYAQQLKGSPTLHEEFCRRLGSKRKEILDRYAS